jgi:hypothetical protein
MLPTQGLDGDEDALVGIQTTPAVAPTTTKPAPAAPAAEKTTTKAPAATKDEVLEVTPPSTTTTLAAVPPVHTDAPPATPAEPGYSKDGEGMADGMFTLGNMFVAALVLAACAGAFWFVGGMRVVRRVGARMGMGGAGASASRYRPVARDEMREV